METIELVKQELYHKEFNLARKDNLNQLPQSSAVFGIFSIVNEEPVNCRYIGETGNLQLTIKDLFENPISDGLKKYMQGPWIKMILYKILSDDFPEDRIHLLDEWKKQYQPKIDDDGEYPGYYEF